MENILDNLGKKYNTDKASTFLCQDKTYQGHDYLKYYELFLKELVNEEFTLTELGCFTGASLRMWKEYFPKAHIVGVDLNPNLKTLEEENINFICSNATAEDLPAKLTQFSNIKCIIDDCSHAWGEQRLSFEMLFPILISGGYYIIEDFEWGALGAYNMPKVLDAQVFWDYVMDRMKILRVSENRNPKAYRPFFNHLPKHIQDLELSIDMAITIPGSIIFRKK